MKNMEMEVTHLSPILVLINSMCFLKVIIKIRCKLVILIKRWRTFLQTMKSCMEWIHIRRYFKIFKLMMKRPIINVKMCKFYVPNHMILAWRRMWEVALMWRVHWNQGFQGRKNLSKTMKIWILKFLSLIISSPLWMIKFRCLHRTVSKSWSWGWMKPSQAMGMTS